MNANWADMDSDDSDDEDMEIPIQAAGLNDGVVQVSCAYMFLSVERSLPSKVFREGTCIFSFYS